ncbi:MAG: acylneuraminate cytidylyltransferase family protein [Candidatus Thioglobus sp.]
MSNSQEVLALIPARGGSKSIPRKNIRLVSGKPLIYYSIRDAIACPGISRVIVTTDDCEIAKIARYYGAETPFIRPKSISGDFSLDIEFHTHALNWLIDNEGYKPDLVMNLRPTNPVRNIETLQKSIDLINSNDKADSVRSVRLSELSPYKMWTIDDSTELIKPVCGSHADELYNMPRQKLPMTFWQDGYVDVARTTTVLEKKSTTGDIIMPLIINEDSVDIDYEESIFGAEILLNGGSMVEANMAMNKFRSSNKFKRHPS